MKIDGMPDMTLNDHHENVLNLTRKLNHSLSASSLRPSTSMASSASARLEQGDRKRIEAMLRVRQKTSAEVLDAKAKAIMQKTEVAEARQEKLYEEKRLQRAKLQAVRDRAADRLEAKFWQDVQHDELLGRRLDQRLTKASTRVERITHKRDVALSRQAERGVKLSIKAAKGRERLQKAEIKHAEAIKTKLGHYEEQVDKLQAARAAAAELSREKGRLLQEDHEERNQRRWAAKAVALAFTKTKHDATDERLQGWKEERQRQLELRRSASVRSSEIQRRSW